MVHNTDEETFWQLFRGTILTCVKNTHVAPREGLAVALTFAMSFTLYGSHLFHIKGCLSKAVCKEAVGLYGWWPHRCGWLYTY